MLSDGMKTTGGWITLTRRVVSFILLRQYTSVVCFTGYFSIGKGLEIKLLLEGVLIFPGFVKYRMSRVFTQELSSLTSK